MSDIHVVQNTFEAWKQAVEAVILSSEECLTVDRAFRKVD